MGEPVEKIPYRYPLKKTGPQPCNKIHKDARNGWPDIPPDSLAFFISSGLTYVQKITRYYPVCIPKKLPVLHNTFALNECNV